MSHVFFKQYYMDFVEYCFRAHYQGRNRLPDVWLNFINTWFEHISEEDEAFLAFVFSDRFKRAFDGCTEYAEPQQECDTARNKMRLFRLEKDFAVTGGLTRESANTDMWY